LKDFNRERNGTKINEGDKRCEYNWLFSRFFQVLNDSSKLLDYKETG
jgi:hypothetical protein